jgi:hypothetical protein
MRQRIAPHRAEKWVPVFSKNDAAKELRRPIGQHQ